MKSNWKTKKLGEIFDLRNGRGFKKTEWADHGLPIIRIQNLNDPNAEFNYFLGNYSPEIEINAGDLLFSWSGTVGSSFGPHIWHRRKGLLNQHIFKINFKQDMDRMYAFYSLKYITTEVEKRVNGSVGLVHITKEKLKEFIITTPPISEQQRIVAILDKVFDGIEKAKENTKKNFQNAKELFESHLHSVFANPGKDWENKTLADISLEFGRGKSKHRPRNDKTLYGGTYPFIQTGDIRNADHLIKAYSQTYNEIGLKQSKLWPRGTICITIAANIAETGILDFDACFPDSVIGLVLDPQKANEYFMEYLLSFFKINLQSKSKGSAQKNINMGTFEYEKFPIPSISNQKSIVIRLDALAAKTKQLEVLYQQKLLDLEELKRSVLKQAFSGEL